ncbi:glycosyltransferase family 4 protein [Caenimonas sp. SL110]|uniref:glycosyltransferase family 4 protein n=1 Tax=Caenimonas sp. SL110 TaxID=1450524 RepID=UPI0006528A56|nr:glycosyltransferase family 4 protein [Caenimonas sp. SL110]
MHTNPITQPVATARSQRYIYLASPWTPVCGGIYKVVDYLVQSQDQQPPATAAQLRPLDTRSGGPAVFSAWFLFVALLRIIMGRISGRLAGVHVNVAERLSLIRKGSIVVLCKAIGVPVVVHLHAQMKNFYHRIPRPFQWFARWVFNAADAVVVLGPSAHKFVLQDLGVPPERVELVYNGVPEPVVPRREFDPQAVRHVLFLGRLDKLKGVADLIEAVAQPGFDRERLCVKIAGGGDIAPYEAQARALGLDGIVRFQGMCDQAQVAHLLSQADVLVLPSYDEVLPLVILEALANGVAVVCTPVGEVSAVLTDNLNTRFIQPGDVAGIARELQAVLADGTLMETLGSNGRALYDQHFSLARYFAGIARMHERCFGISAAAAKS